MSGIEGGGMSGIEGGGMSVVGGLSHTLKITTGILHSQLLHTTADLRVTGEQQHASQLHNYCI